MITTPAQRRATANAHKKREAAGLKRATFWLSAEDRAALETLKATTGKSKDALVSAGIRALGMPQKPVQPPPAVPAPTPAPHPLKGDQGRSGGVGWRKAPVGFDPVTGKPVYR